MRIERHKQRIERRLGRIEKEIAEMLEDKHISAGCISTQRLAIALNDFWCDVERIEFLKQND